VPAKRKERIMVQLSLEAKEKEILIWALRSAVSDLGAEIADTEKQEFREDLKERKAVLQSVLQRLG
jgi:hypothetical protein